MQCAARVTVLDSVCVCVCLSVNRELTSRASFRPENDITYSAADEGQKICGVLSETPAFERYGVKRSEKANMLMRIAYRDGFLRSCWALFYERGY